MADILREMDPATRAFLAIFLAVIVKGILAVQWERYKARQNAQPTPMRLRHGVYVPWGAVDRIRRIFNVMVNIWIVYMVVLLAGLAYMKIMGLERLF